MTRAASFAIALPILGFCVPAYADEDPAPPVYEGHPALTRYTKEISLDAAALLTEDGFAAGGGLSVGAFYTRWLSSFAGATYGPAFAGPRERWEARGGFRFVYPEPLFGSVFGYALLGPGVQFTATEADDSFYRRALVGIVGVGLLTNVAERIRVRLELREAFLVFGSADTKRTETLSLSLVLISR